jgi:hypothetical protein
MDGAKALVVVEAAGAAFRREKVRFEQEEADGATDWPKPALAA